MKTVYGIIAGLLFIAAGVGAYLGFCKSETRTTRWTKLTNLFGTIVGGVKRYTVDLFRAAAPAPVDIVLDDTVPMGA